MADGGQRAADDFEEVALPFVGDVARFALSLSLDETEADDLVQEVYLRALKGWHTFVAGTECRKWLFTICRNVYFKRRRISKRMLFAEESDVDAMPAVLLHVAAHREGLGDLFDQIDVRPAIEIALRALPEPHHSILVLIDLEGFSYEETAEMLEIPVGTVRSRLYRARRRIQEHLIEHARDMGLATGAPR